MANGSTCKRGCHIFTVPASGWYRVGASISLISCKGQILYLYFFMGMNFLLAVFTYFFICETKGISLEHMDTVFGGVDHVLGGEKDNVVMLEHGQVFPSNKCPDVTQNAAKP